jgi:hypothetical protein
MMMIIIIIILLAEIQFLLRSDKIKIYTFKINTTGILKAGRTMAVIEYDNEKQFTF